MARKALLIWCVGAAVACGTAAVATTTLWRPPAEAAAPFGDVIALPEIAVPGPLADLDDRLAADAVVPMIAVSFYEAPMAAQPFRGTFDAAPPIAATLAAVPQTEFLEVAPPPQGLAERLAVRPPPRPAFLPASRPDPAAGGTLAEVEAAPAGTGFETPAAPPVPAFALGDLFRPLGDASRPERVLNAGLASWYGPGFHGRKTASGERFDQNDLTAAHRTLPFGTRVKVVDETSGRSVVVRINDRGPFKHGRVIDLSKGAAQALGVGGLSRVKVVSAN